MRLGYILPAVLLLPIAWAQINCDKLNGKESIQDVFMDCKDSDSLNTAVTGVNLKLGGLTPDQINSLLKSKKTIDVGLDFTNSTANEIVFAKTAIALPDDSFIVFDNNPNLVEIRMFDVTSIGTNNAQTHTQEFRVTGNPNLLEVSFKPAFKSAVRLTIRGNPKLPLDVVNANTNFFTSTKHVSTKPGECYFATPVNNLDKLNGCSFIYGNLTFAKDATGDSWNGLKAGLTVENGSVTMENTKIKTLDFLASPIPGTFKIVNNEFLCPIDGPNIGYLDNNCPSLCISRKHLETKTACTIVDIRNNTKVTDMDKRVVRAVLERIEEIRGPLALGGIDGDSLQLKIKKMGPGGPLGTESPSLTLDTFTEKITVAQPPAGFLFDFKRTMLNEDQINEITGIEERMFRYEKATTTSTTTTSTTPPSTTTASPSTTTAATTSAASSGTEAETEGPDKTDATTSAGPTVPERPVGSGKTKTVKQKPPILSLRSNSEDIISVLLSLPPPETKPPTYVWILAAINLLIFCLSIIAYVFVRKMLKDAFVIDPSNVADGDVRIKKDD